MASQLGPLQVLGGVWVEFHVNKSIVAKVGLLKLLNPSCTMSESFKYSPVATELEV